jgi:tetratricopeptide (TPR) repeat protein
MKLIRSGRDLDQARALLLRSSAIDPRSDAVYWMGKYYLAVGEPERALEKFSSYLEFDPTRVDAYLAASRILQERGRRQEARDLLERGSSYFESRREASEPRPDPGVAMRYNRKALEIHAYHDASIVRLEAELERIDGSGDGS